MQGEGKQVENYKYYKHYLQNIILMTNQTQQFKQLVSSVKSEDQIPKAESMVTVSSLMTTGDHVQFGNMISIFVDIPHHTSGESQIFSVRPQQLVPRSAVIQRDESSQLVGISAVSGG